MSDDEPQGSSPEALVALIRRLEGQLTAATAGIVELESWAIQPPFHSGALPSHRAGE